MLSLCHMQTNKKTKLVVKICSILFLGTFLFCACSSRERTETSFLQAESLLEEHPDSALQLLQTLPALQELFCLKQYQLRQLHSRILKNQIHSQFHLNKMYGACTPCNRD